MKKQQVLFIQGAGENVHDAWDDKLVASLRTELGPGYDVRYPSMPDEAEPNFDRWSAAIRNEISSLRDGADVVGHSIGGTIMINALAQHPPARAITAIVLVATPFVGEGGWPSDGWTPPRSLGASLPKRIPVHLFQGDADETTPASHADQYARAIPWLQLHRLAGRDHQLNGDLREVARVISA